MKKLTLLVACMLLAVLPLSAQSSFSKGDKVVSAGIGLGNTLHGSNYSISLPPLFVGMDYAVVDGLIDGNASIGVGGYLGYSSSKYKVADYKSTIRDYVFGVRGSFHYQFIDNLDTYAGLMLGYDVVSHSNSHNNYKVDSNSFIIPFFIGARYYFSDTFAVMGELGYGISVLNVGVSFKF